ncbi:MAG TPA: hypothetical protein VFQ35_19255 [Polyangiaceae bacterium]|nr:hypothetical protein [Polyangiaceae bacterium]
MSSSDDPTRLRDSALSGEERLAQLFRAAGDDLPSATQLEALAGRLGPVLDAPTPPRVPRTFSKLGALGGTAAVLAIVGGYLVSRSAPHVEPAPLPAHSSSSQPASPPKQEASAPVAEPVPPPSSSVEVAPVLSAPRGASAKPDEATLLEQARRALASDPRRALALTQRHQALYPRGVLVQEREVIAIEALRRLGREGQASDRANSFEKSYPDSAHRRAVEKGLGK